MRRLLFLLSFIIILGAGCIPSQSSVPPYVPGDIPTDEQLEVMTDEEKRAGMEAMLNDHPMDELDEYERKEELSESIAYMRDGTTIRHADFEGRFLHPAEGSVRVVEDDGKYSLVFSDDFSVLPGPALYVYLSTENRPDDAGKLLEEGLEVLKLKTSKGTQVYEIPASVNFEDIHSIVVVCKPFRFIFASAGF